LAPEERRMELVVFTVGGILGLFMLALAWMMMRKG
jgi:hypothetical protein